MDEVVPALNAFLHAKGNEVTVDRLELDTYQITILTGWFTVTTCIGLWYEKDSSIFLDADHTARDDANYRACALVGERLINVRAQGASLNFDTVTGSRIRLIFEGDGESGSCTILGDPAGPFLL